MKKVISLLILLCFTAACSTENVSVYQITTSAEPTEAGVITPSNGNYDEGEQVEISASSNEHWVFDSWGGDLDGSSNPESITVDSDKEIVAIFLKREYPVTFDIIGEGTVTEEVVKLKSTEYEYGSHIELTAKPSEGWSFVRWGGDLSESKNPLTVTVDNELNISVYFDENPFDGGNGTVEYPYLISTIEQLQQVEDYIDGNFKLISDIDASDTVNWNGGKGFMPLFLDSRINFSGTLDGQGFKIKSLYISRSGEQNIGLFGSTMDSEIRNMIFTDAKVHGGNSVGVLGGVSSGDIVNIRILNSEVNGNYSVGGIVGRNVRELSKAKFFGVVKGGSNVGGIAGNNNGSISKTCAHATVIGDGDSIGGVVGDNFGSFELSCSTGEVIGNDRVGGLIGDHRFPFDNISKSYSHSSIKGNSIVGGLIGSNRADDELKNSFSSGKVMGNEDVGGLMGLNDGFVSGFYWDMESSGMDEAVGRGRSTGTNALDSSQMTGSNAEENMSEFDWENVWVTTDDYPILRWELSDNE